MLWIILCISHLVLIRPPIAWKIILLYADNVWWGVLRSKISRRAKKNVYFWINYVMMEQWREKICGLILKIIRKKLF